MVLSLSSHRFLIAVLIIIIIYQLVQIDCQNKFIKLLKNEPPSKKLEKFVGTKAIYRLVHTFFKHVFLPGQSFAIDWWAPIADYNSVCNRKLLWQPLSRIERFFLINCGCQNSPSRACIPSVHPITMIDSSCMRDLITSFTPFAHWTEPLKIPSLSVNDYYYLHLFTDDLLIQQTMKSVCLQKHNLHLYLAPIIWSSKFVRCIWRFEIQTGVQGTSIEGVDHRSWPLLHRHWKWAVCLYRRRVFGTGEKECHVICSCMFCTSM